MYQKYNWGEEESDALMYAEYNMERKNEVKVLYSRVRNKKLFLYNSRKIFVYIIHTL